MKVLGLDLSLSSTGVATVSAGGAVTSAIRPRTTGFRRLQHLLDDLDGFLLPEFPDLVVVEGPSYASSGRSQHERAGLWWLVAMKLWALGVPTAVVSPGGRAKYGTGRGNAGKDEVLLAVARRYPDVEVRGNDEADALLLAAMGARHLGYPIEDSLPAAHLAALDPVLWPVPGGPSFPLHEKA